MIKNITDPLQQIAPVPRNGYVRLIVPVDIRPRFNMRHVRFHQYVAADYRFEISIAHLSPSERTQYRLYRSQLPIVFSPRNSACKKEGVIPDALEKQLALVPDEGPVSSRTKPCVTHRIGQEVEGAKLWTGQYDAVTAIPDNGLNYF